MLRCGICSDSILIYVVGVSSLSVAEQPLLPCHGKSGRGGNYWKLGGLGKLKMTLEPHRPRLARPMLVPFRVN